MDLLTLTLALSQNWERECVLNIAQVAAEINVLPIHCQTANPLVTVAAADGGQSLTVNDSIERKSARV